MKKKRIVAVCLGLVLAMAVIAVCYVSFGTLSDEAAGSIALGHAGVSEEEVDYVRADRDFDDGVLHYDVEFHVGSCEYDYEIHAKTGEVLSVEKDGPDGNDYVVKAPTGNTNKDVPEDAGKAEDNSGQNKTEENKGKEASDGKDQSSGVNEGTVSGENTSSVKITKEEAEAIALAHAGLAKEQVVFDHTEYDGDDRYPEYEIEFYCDGWEYQYEVHAETGEILRNEKEWDD